MTNGVRNAVFVILVAIGVAIYVGVTKAWLPATASFFATAVMLGIAVGAVSLTPAPGVVPEAVDGELLQVTGTIVAGGPLVVSPYQRRPCAMYAYLTVSSDGPQLTRGEDFVPVIIQSEQGSIHVPQVPDLTDFFMEPVMSDDPNQAIDELQRQALRSMFGKAEPVHFEASVAPGDRVTALGRYRARDRSLVGDVKFVPERFAAPDRPYFRWGVALFMVALNVVTVLWMYWSYD